MSPPLKELASPGGHFCKEEKIKGKESKSKEKRISELMTMHEH
jgi:hypothetical protein